MISKSIYFRAVLALAFPVMLLLSCSKSQPAATTTAVKSNVKKVLSVTFNKLTPQVSATVDGGGFWRAQVPAGTDLAHLVTTVVCSDNGNATSPLSGTAWDFTVNGNGIVDFVITAEDGTIGTIGIQVTAL